jgi:hypothetical protein
MTTAEEELVIAILTNIPTKLIRSPETVAANIVRTLADAGYEISAPMTDAHDARCRCTPAGRAR